MTQLHTVHRRLGVVPPTNSVDIVLHGETSRGVPARTATALETIGYRLLDFVDPRQNTAHRFVRDGSKIDLLTGAVGAMEGATDTVDVLRSDHPAPAVVESLRGRQMVAIEGGTQALRRTVNARLEITPGTLTTISAPQAVRRGSAEGRWSRPTPAIATAISTTPPRSWPASRTRSPSARSSAGSDRKRLLRLADALPQSHPAWRTLPRAPARTLRRRCAS